jgi:hypothetical protein
MDTTTLLFSLLLLLVGLLCILIVSREFNEAAVNDERRREMERAAIMERRRMEQRRRKIWSLIDAAYTSFNTKVEQQEQLLLVEKRDEAVDPWAGFSPSQIGAAFNEFLRQTRIND